MLKMVDPENNKEFQINTRDDLLNFLDYKWEKAVPHYEAKTHSSEKLRSAIPSIVEIGKQFRSFMSLSGDKLKVLDIGCGNGLYDGKPYPEIGHKYIDSGHDLYGVDVIDYLTEYEGLFLKASAERLPFQADFFDCVVCFSAIDHVVRPWKVFSEARRVLKEGGEFFVMVGTHHNESKLIASTQNHHMFDFSIDAVLGLYKQAGFKYPFTYEGPFKNSIYFFRGEK